MQLTTQTIQAHVLEEGDWIALSEISRTCRLESSELGELVELGVLTRREPQPGYWQIPAAQLPRLRVMVRLMRDLGVNVSGAALAVELLESRRDLQRRIAGLERLLGQ